MEKLKWGFYSFLAGSLIGFIIYAGSTFGSYHNATAVKINDTQYIFKNGSIAYIVNTNKDGSLIIHFFTTLKINRLANCSIFAFNLANITLVHY